MHELPCSRSSAIATGAPLIPDFRQALGLTAGAGPKGEQDLVSGM